MTTILTAVAILALAAVALTAALDAVNRWVWRWRLDHAWDDDRADTFDPEATPLGDAAWAAVTRGARS